MHWGLLLCLHQLLSFAGLAFAPTYLTRIATFGVIAVLDYAALRDLSQSPLSDVLRFVNGCMIGAITIWDLYRLALVPEPTIAFRIRGQKPAQTLGEKFSWAQRVMGTARGIGLESQIPYLAFPTSTSRSAFILARLKHVVLSLATITLCFLTLQLFEMKWFVNPEGGSLPVLWQEVLRRLTMTPFHLYTSYCVLDVSATLGSIVSVALGMASPTEWPPVFGPFTAEWTVAGCWSRTWHQFIRLPLAIWGDIAVSKLQLPPKSSIAHFTRITLAFFMSGVFHSAGDFAVSGPNIRSVHWWSYKLFWSQPFAILLEYPFIQWSRRSGFGKRHPTIARLIGSVWVLMWFSFTYVPFALQNFNEEGWDQGEEAMKPLRETLFSRR